MKKLIYFWLFTILALASYSAIVNAGSNYTNSNFATASSIASGTTGVTGATNGNCLYNNSGTLGDKSCGGGLTVGSTTVGSGTDKYLLYNNAGTLGNESVASILSSPPAI